MRPVKYIIDLYFPAVFDAFLFLVTILYRGHMV